MTVKQSYKNIYYNDCDSVTSWVETRSNMLDGDTTFTTDGDMFRLQGTLDSLIEQEYFYEEFDLTAVATISPTLYPILLIRHKTDTGSNGMECYVQVVYDDNSTDEFVLGYSTVWKVTKCTLTPGVGATNVSKIRLFADEGQIDSPNGTYSAYYDWFIFCAGIFTYPHVAPGDIRIHYAMKKAQIEIPGRDGDILQRLGQKSPQITINGNVLPGEAWESADPDFDYFLRSIQIDTVSYFSCDKPDVRGLVMWDSFDSVMNMSGSEADLRWQLSLTLFKLGPYSSFQDWEWMYGSETGF